MPTNSEHVAVMPAENFPNANVTSQFCGPNGAIKYVQKWKYFKYVHNLVTHSIYIHIYKYTYIHIYLYT